MLKQLAHVMMRCLRGDEHWSLELTWRDNIVIWGIQLQGAAVAMLDANRGSCGEADEDFPEAAASTLLPGPHVELITWRPNTTVKQRQGLRSWTQCSSKCTRSS